MPPPLSGGAVDMGLVRCWSGIAATAKADGGQTIAGADGTHAAGMHHSGRSTPTITKPFYPGSVPDDLTLTRADTDY